MNSLQVVGPDGALELVDTEVPAVGINDVLVEVEAASVGLTVYKAIHGRISGGTADRPRIPGHEVVGRVVDVGDGVTDVVEGERVAAYFYLSCGRCDACRT
ncbi:MAG: alcohol dehydrogenase catalytic domain-containing protein, partial [Halobacteriales archaeon]|nr:alcohol dehydrogenase catalytic domain-containing protein [Halobacteriales archaeon]